MCLALPPHGGTRCSVALTLLSEPAQSSPGPETHAVATPGLGAGSVLGASTQQNTEHQKQRVGDYHSPEERANQVLPSETDQSLPPTEHSAHRTPVLPPRQRLVSFKSLAPDKSPAQTPLTGSMGEKEDQL